MKRFSRTAEIFAVALVTTVAGSALIAQNRSAAPIARYAVDVGTTTGMAAMAGKGMGGGLSMMFGGGGGGKEAHELHFRLGSTLAPTKGTPKADHFVPPVAKLGKSVPLITPGRAPSDTPAEFQRPKGRIVLFWGCGAKAGKGQPVIIDFARVAAGQMPPGLFSTRVPTDRGPQLTNSRTYGEWPNTVNGKTPAPGSSVLGDHRIAANYAPEIKFNLTQDYMPGITGRSSAMPGGATGLSWNSVAGATGYYAWAMGMKMEGQGEPRDFVWWTSSSLKEFGGGLWDWLPPETVRRLITEKVVMPPSQTSCTVPAEVKNYAPDFMMGNLYAYGPEANFSYPPRPANPATPWNLEWTAKIRYRSNTSWFIKGPNMGGMSGDQGQSEQRPCKPSVFGVLTGGGC
jgi:hypothetical protein